jgi:biotin carboxyl carrier protein
MAEELIAPLSGTIVSINIETGAIIEEDDEIMVLEAMKMENPVYAPCSGTVTELRVKLRDNVEEDDVLGVIEPS